MNITEIKNKLEQIRLESIREGRTPNSADMVILDSVIRFYLTESEVDYEEVEWLYKNYLQNGNLDFPKAKQMADWRIQSR